MKENSIWECLKCGECCRSFVRTGPEISDKEKEEILNSLNNSKIVKFIHGTGLKLDWIKNQINEREYIPVIGNAPPKRCVFLSNNNLCMIHEIRPKICRNYPLEVISPNKIKVDLDCQRSEQIIEKLEKGNYPLCIKDEINTEKDIKVEAEHFFDRKISDRD